jgi:Predicted glycosyl hydrolase
MEKRTKIAIIGSALAVIILVIALISVIVEKLTPSKEIMMLTDYYKLKDSEVEVILQNEFYEKKGILINDKVYMDYNTIVEKFNKRIYWDKNENVLTYTTPTDIIRVEADSKEFSDTKSTIETKNALDYPVVKVFGDQVYIAMDFVQQYSDMNYKFYKEPNRIVVNYIWGDYLFSDVNKATQLRYEPKIKSPILQQLAPGAKLVYVDKKETPKNGFLKVMTEDGIKGYVKKNMLSKATYEKVESKYQKPQYTSQTRPGKINMVFHQVFNKTANLYLENLIAKTKQVNVVAPTWFSVNNESGAFTSLASQSYVDRAKSIGLEVWAVVDDVNNVVNMKELLSHTSKRDKLSNALIEEALTYKLNGINIDFEKIPLEAGPDYIQFLRELSVKCRNNGIVLSVDNYVPSAYTEYYDREEQGIIADYVVVMAYDEFHSSSDVAGPVASIGFVKDAVNNILKLVPKEKTIIGIPFYNRLWKETDGAVTSDSMSMSDAKTLIAVNGLKPKWDEKTGCYYVEYKKDGSTYRLWQEEEKSLEEKMKVIYDANMAGTAAWKLGLESKGVWDVIIRYLN